MASRWQKDAKQLVNAAQRLVLVGAQKKRPVCSSYDHDCSTAGVSRHSPACGLIRCWNRSGAGRYPAPAISLSYGSQLRLLNGRCQGCLPVCRL